MAADSESPQDRYATRLKESVDQLRGNVKWTLVAFGAIGTTLLAGSQLSNLGKFSYDEGRLWLALAFAMLALCAAAFAVNAVLKVAYTGHVNINNLDSLDHDEIRKSPGLLAGYSSTDQIAGHYVRRINARFLHFKQGVDLDVLEADDATLGFIEDLIDSILSYVRYTRILRQAQWARRRLFFASILAAIGLVGFAWAANPPSAAPTVVLQSPAAPAKLLLTEAGIKTFMPVLGAACATLKPIEVITLNVSTSGSEVVTLKSQACPVARFTLTPALGELSDP